MKSRLAIKRKGDENVEPSSRAKRTLFTGGHTPAKVQSTISSKVRSGLKKVVSSLHPNQHGKRMVILDLKSYITMLIKYFVE